MTATQDNSQSIPQRAGVYIIRDADTPSITLYVGIASNLKTRLSSGHPILEYCRVRGINYYIDYELQPNESKRKKREHQLISELDATLNDKGIQPRRSRKKSTSQSSGTAWRDDIYALADRIKREEAGLSFEPEAEGGVGDARRQIELCRQWVEYAWSNIYRAKAFLNYGTNNRATKSADDYYSWVNKYIPNLGGWLEFIDRLMGGDRDPEIFTQVYGCVPLNFSDPREICNQYGSSQKFWIDRDLKVTEGGQFLLQGFAEVLHGEPLDQNPEGLEKRFRSLLMHLHPPIADQWEPFKREYKNMRGINDERFWMRDITQDFCDHALLWSTVNRIKLFNYTVNREALFSKFFLEHPSKHKHQVEKLNNHRYVSVSAFILALIEHFEDAYGLEYRIRDSYSPRSDSIAARVDLRLNPHKA